MNQASGSAHPKNDVAVARERDRMIEVAGLRDREPWGGLLVSAGPRDHIVQLYEDQEFLNRAVCRFAASAIANGEGVILVPTAAHWDAFRPRLEAEGVDIDRATDAGQLT